MDVRPIALALLIAATLGTGCLETPSAAGTDAAAGADVVGSWLEDSASPDLLLHFYPNRTAYVRYLLTVQNVEESMVTRPGTWEPLSSDRVNLSFTAPFTRENRTMTLQVDEDRARVIRVYNDTAELPESQQGRVDARFVRVSRTGS